MDGWGIVRVALEHRLQERHRPRHLIGLGVGGDQQRVGGDHRDRIVLGIGAGKCIHRFGKALVALAGITGIAQLHRRDQAAFLLRAVGGEPLGIGGHFCEPLTLGIVDRIVDGGPCGIGLAPAAHGAIGVQPTRLLHGTHRSLVREGVRQLHAVAEKCLRLCVARADLEAALAIAGQDCRSFAGLHRIPAPMRAEPSGRETGRRGKRSAEQEQCGCDGKNTHDEVPGRSGRAPLAVCPCFILPDPGGR